MHPAYGAGHATVAGACVTILKAFFDTDKKLAEVVSGADQFYAADMDNKLHPSVTASGADATVANELDKLAANISIGRNIAGVHYYSDYYDSLRMGERIAVSILEEQMFTYHEPVEMTFKTFDGDKMILSTHGGQTKDAVTTKIVDSAGQPVSRRDWWVRDVVDYGIVEANEPFVG